MTKSTLLPAILAILFAALLNAAPALALNGKSYVSRAGSDANPCDTVANACATFAHALTQTAAGGEITVVNTGDYGTVSIGKSVHITNDGAGEASVLVSALGITVNAGAGDIVSLRGLVIDGQGVGAAGISIVAASAVHIQNCVIRNLEAAISGFGIFLQPSGSTQLFVSDTIIFNNGSSGGTGGIYIGPSGTGKANVVLDRIHLENNVVGLLVDGSLSTGNGAHVVIRDSVVSGNASHGIEALSATGKAAAFVVVERTSSVNNGGTGILASGPHATMLLHDTTVVRNGVGISAVSSGQLISYGTNDVNNNIGPDGTPTGSYSPI